jgi:hypothetical protein
VKKRSDGWLARASCKGLDPDLFFPLLDDVVDDNGDVLAHAGDWPDVGMVSELCYGCPVKNECFDYAMSLPINENGFWSGTTRGARKKIRVMQEEAGVGRYGDGIMLAAQTMAAEDTLCL